MHAPAILPSRRIIAPSRGLIIPDRRPIARPHRHRRECPLYRREVLAMAAGDRMLDASGNVILDASGNVQLSDGSGDSCCCTTPGNPCHYCSGTTPSQWTLTVSGVNPCGSCTGLRNNVLALTVNGTFTLTQLAGSTPDTGPPCEWFTVAGVGSINYDNYNADGCAGGIASNNTYALSWILTCNGTLGETPGDFKLRCSFSSFSNSVFHSVGTSGSCGASISFSNIAACGTNFTDPENLGTYIAFGTGGGATITPA